MALFKEECEEQCRYESLELRWFRRAFMTATIEKRMRLPEKAISDETSYSKKIQLSRKGIRYLWPVSSY